MQRREIKLCMGACILSLDGFSIEFFGMDCQLSENAEQWASDKGYTPLTFSF